MDTESLLALTNAILGVLFLISELLGASRCPSNGVIEYLIGGIECLEKVRAELKEELVEVKEPVVVVV